MSENTTNDVTVSALVEVDERCNSSSPNISMTLLDVPQYNLTLHNQTVDNNLMGHVTLGKEITLRLTVDFPQFTQNATAVLNLIHNDSKKRIEPKSVSTLSRGDNLIVDLPVDWLVAHGRFNTFEIN